MKRVPAIKEHPIFVSLVTTGSILDKLIQNKNDPSLFDGMIQ